MNDVQLSFFKRHQKIFIGLLVFLMVVILPLKIMGEILTTLTESSPGRIIEGKGEDIIAVLNLDGVLVESPPGGGLDSLTGEYTSVRRLRSVLNEIKQEERLAGLIIRINSPGGSAAASEEMYQLLLSFKNETEVPILAYFSDTAASGAYYLSMGADEIMANPNAITGSIGVIVTALNYRQLAENWGIEQVVFKSGEYKDLLNPFEETDPAERRIIEGLVSDIYENFVATVATGRGMENEAVRELGDGRIFSAREAKDKGLIDEMGPFSAGIDLVKERSGKEEVTVVEYGTETSLIGLFLASLSQRLSVSLWPGANNPLYSQKPGMTVWFLLSP